MASRPDPLDQEIRALYQGPLAEFTPARQSLLKRLQKAKDPRAAEIKELRKPTPSAWAINLLFAHEPQAMAAVLALGARAHAGVERALAKSDGAEVRAALETIRTASARLAERATELLSAQNAAPSAAVLERLRGNLEALVLDPAQAALAERGWLEVDLDAPGFDVLAALQLAAEKGRGRPEPARPAPATATATGGAKALPIAKPAPEPKPSKAELAKRDREDAERERRIADARAELARLEAAAETRRKAAESAASAAVEANAKAAEAASAAELARRAAHDARRAADAAAAEVVRAREAVRRAENA